MGSDDVKVRCACRRSSASVLLGLHMFHPSTAEETGGWGTESLRAGTELGLWVRRIAQLAFSGAGP